MQRLRRQIARALLTGPLTFWDLLPLQDGDLASFASALEEMAEEGLLVRRPDGTLALTEAGTGVFSEMLPRQGWECPRCGGTGMVPEGRFATLLDRWRRLAAARPAPALAFDQGYISPQDTIGRVIFMYRRGDLEGQRLFFLGDDDLTSLAAALTGLPKAISVLEIDERLVNFLNRTARELGWTNFKAETYDAQEPLPLPYRQSFDVAVTDPVETRRGFLVFLSRCAHALEQAGAAVYFGLTRLETSPAKWGDWLAALLEMGLVPTDILPAFHHYDLENTAFVAEEYPQARRFLPDRPPQKPWYSSSLIRMEAVRPPRPLFAEAVHLGPELYRD